MLSRLMMKFALLCFAVVAFASPFAAQNKPAKPKANLSGSWLLDAKKSNSAGLTSRPDLPIKISHQEPELRTTLTSESNGQLVERNFVYFTDGRGETNEATSALTTNPTAFKANDLKNQVTKSKTNWSGNTVVTRSILAVNAGGRIVQFEQIDEWKLSNDGKVLTQTTRIIPETGVGVLIMASSKKRVYNRV